MAIPKVKNATQFRETLYDTLKRVAEGEPHLITQKESEPVVLISQKEFDRLTDERETLRAIAIGAAEADSGQVVSHQTALKRLKALKSRWK
jgi:prevent-host-death family protein